MALFLYLCQAQMLRFVYIIFHSTSLNESFVNMIIVTHKICLVGVAHSWASGETVPRPYLLGKTVTSLGLLFMSWAMWWDSGMSILAQIEISMYKLSTKISCRVRSYNIESQVHQPQNNNLFLKQKTCDADVAILKTRYVKFVLIANNVNSAIT